MIDEPRLRDGLARLLTATEDNIRRRCDDDATVNQPLQEHFESARKAGRTGLTFGVWRENEITQAGVAWLLACVFVRFLEDNDLLGEVYLAGPDGRTKSAMERRTHWYRANPRGNDREYLLGIFSDLVRLPGMKGLLDREHNPLWSLGPDGDGAKAIIDFFQATDPDTGQLRHDFTGSADNTRFLGDLYQNISAGARKRYALVQTPDFVVSFLLDRTLDPALDEFGLKGFRLIDPSCGSGHFLIEAFARIFRKLARSDTEPTVAAQNALDCIVGIDLNPYAIAIARFRLLMAAIRACDIHRLSSLPDWETHLAVGDSLLFGPHNQNPQMWSLAADDSVKLHRFLRAQEYRVVVGNPPYIQVQDAELRAKYRGLYSSCSRKYQISIPFTELFFRVASADGYIGMITSNAFIKKAFGRPLVEELFPLWDLTHVIDSSGVYLDGFGTPTVILLGRNRKPVSSTLRVVRGIRGEVVRPEDPANAPVWSELSAHTDENGFEGRFVSVLDAERQSFYRHPWSIGGGGTSQLKERLDNITTGIVTSVVDKSGFFGITAADDIMVAPKRAFRRAKVSNDVVLPLVNGEDVRDWHVRSDECVLFPYTVELLPLNSCKFMERWLWIARTLLGGRVTFSQRTYVDAGRPWWAWHQVVLDRYHCPLKLCYSDVATHNHFALDRGTRAFNRHAPIIKLPSNSGLKEHIGLLGLLNSSTVCFWLRQVCRNKGTGGIGGGLATETWEQFFEFDSAIVTRTPLPTTLPLDFATAIQLADDERSTLLPSAHISRQTPTRQSLANARERARELHLRMIAIQEEMDWHVYHLYGLLEESHTIPIDQVPPVRLGERAFEILMARDIGSGELETEWFARHRSTPRTTIPEHWPEPYRALVQRRLDTIARDRDIALMEQPEYKRRWNLPRWEDLEEEALRNWLLDRLEDPRYWPTNPPTLTSIARLADAVRHDAEFLQVAELYRHRVDFDLTELVEELITRESVPFLPILRYKESGLRKRADWESTWQLQRREDAGETVEIPVPPKYEKDDFLSSDYWRLRGKLDVPKERFIAYWPLTRDADKSLVIAWAGYDHGQHALALAQYCIEMRGMEAWDAARLTPILAGLQELQPWLDQWHNEIDPERQQRLNEFIRSFFEGELAQLSLTADQVRAWRPTAQAARAGRRKKR